MITISGRVFIARQAATRAVLPPSSAQPSYNIYTYKAAIGDHRQTIFSIIATSTLPLPSRAAAINRPFCPHHGHRRRLYATPMDDTSITTDPSNNNNIIITTRSDGWFSSPVGSLGFLSIIYKV